MPWQCGYRGNVPGPGVTLHFWHMKEKQQNDSWKRYKSPPQFQGVLRRNNFLSAAKILHEGKIFGPESLAIVNGTIYTGTADGKILRVENDRVQTLTRLSQQDSNVYEESECGRPLGVRLDGEGRLLVADASLGLYRINITTGHSELLFSTSTLIGGFRSRFLNDVTVTSPEFIYVTDGSVKWGRPDYKMMGLEQSPDGRVIEYNTLSGETSVVCDGVYANGIQNVHGEPYVIVSETVKVRLLKCFTAGPKRGRMEIFTDNLPGYPDNIRSTSSGGYWVALTSVRHPDEAPPIWESLAPYPVIRNIMHKFGIFFGCGFVKKIANLYENPAPTSKTYGMVLELDKHGNIIRGLHDPSGHVVGISHAHEYEGQLFLGSATNNYIGVLSLNDKRID